MIAWHLGMTVLAVRYVYRDPAMDLRWVLAGALLPDLIDKPIGAVLLNDVFHAHRLFGHTLLFPTALLGLVMVVTRRGSALRKGMVGLVIGVLFHLVLDGAWAAPEAFWWPFFGTAFPEQSPSALGPLLEDMITDPRVWVGEAVGLVYLLRLWRTRLQAAGALGRFAGDGRIPPASRA